MRRILADKLHCRRSSAHARLEPIRKAASRNSPYSCRTANRIRKQAVAVIRNAVVVPSHAEVQRKSLPDFPVIFEEEAHFVLVRVAHTLREGLVILKCIQL